MDEAKEKKKLYTYTHLDALTVRCTIKLKASGEEPEMFLPGTFLGLMRNDEHGVVAVVHFDGEPMLDTVETSEVTLEGDE